MAPGLTEQDDGALFFYAGRNSHTSSASHDDPGDEEEAHLGAHSAHLQRKAPTARRRAVLRTNGAGPQNPVAAAPVVLVTRLRRAGLQDCVTFLQDPRVTSSLEDHRVKYLQVCAARTGVPAHCYLPRACPRLF